MVAKLYERHYFIRNFAIKMNKTIHSLSPQVILASVSPIVTQLPKWIELGAYLEFGDDEVRLCESCHDLCEWVYFKLLHYNSDGLELCARCMEKCKDKFPWKLYVREGLMLFLGHLNALVTPPVSEKPRPSEVVQVPVSVPSKSGSTGSFEQFPSPQSCYNHGIQSQSLFLDSCI